MNTSCSLPRFPVDVKTVEIRYPTQTKLLVISYDLEKETRKIENLVANGYRSQPESTSVDIWLEDPLTPHSPQELEELEPAIDLVR